MLAKTVKQATVWREANCSRDIKNVTASTAQYGRLQNNMGANRSAHLCLFYTTTYEGGTDSLENFALLKSLKIQALEN